MLECWLVDEVLNNSGTVAPYGDGEGGNDDGGDGDHRNDLGVPTVLDGCDGSPLGYSWNDVLERIECDEQGVYAVIYRIFTAIDSKGNKAASATQTITFKLVDPSEFAYEADAADDGSWTFSQEDDGKWVLQVNSCTPSTAELPSIYPIYEDEFGNEVSLDTANCYLSVEKEALARYEICGDGYKEQRVLRVFDWCAGMSMPMFPYLVKVGDFDAPNLAYNACSNIEEIDDPAIVDNFLNWLNPNNGIVYRTFESCGMISTGPMSCTAALNTDLASLERQLGFLLNDCSEELTISAEVYSLVPETIGKIPTGDSVWVLGDYAKQGSMFMGLPEGEHLLYVAVHDGCYNGTHFRIPFTVMDLVKPVMKCDDELRVTLVEGDAKLGIGGYGLATVADVDEGSWDNCELVEMRVRREISGDAAVDYEKKYPFDLDRNEDGVIDSDDNRPFYEAGYTPWKDVVEFFCADLTDKVTVELWGRDRKGNTSICWLDVEVENGTNVGLDLRGNDVTISCEDYAAYLVDGGAFDPYDFAGIYTASGLNDGFIGCSTPDADLTFDADIDQCGFGTITIYIDQSSITADDSKNYIDTDPYDVVVVTVAEIHDYWIKFPEDTKVTCAIPDEAGVEVNEGACDLLTVYENDELFESTQDPDACYKIFRTYKVINWCEYDGESQPVVVSRDWDAHNAVDCYKDREPGAYQGAYTNDYYKDAGEYNLNPLEPDGDGQPGDEDIYVIVEINNVDGLYPTSANSWDDFEDELFDVVYYDNNSNPYDNSTANLWGDDDVNFTSPNPWGGQYVRGDRGRIDEGYWFAITRGENACDTRESAWFDDAYRVADNTDGNQNNGLDTYQEEGGYDVDGNDFNDDADNRYGSYGYWQYTQHIIVYDDSKPEAVVTVGETCVLDGVNCDRDVDFTIAISDTCSTVGITATAVVMPGAIAVPLTANGDNTEFTGTTSEELTLGKYTLVVTVNDGCGNIVVEEEEFEVEDCKGPAPICHEGLIVELMPTQTAGEGMAEVWATDYKASDIYDCTALSNDANGYGIVQDTAYSIYFLDSLDTNADGAITEDEFPTAAQSGITLTCADTPMRPVAIFARDAAGNRDFCLTFVEVQDNNNVCGTNAASGDIAGLVSTEDVFAIEGAEIQLSGGRSMMYMTSAGGDYTFEEVAQGYDYSVTPFKDQDHGNGVSTFDLILIQKHILGTAELDSPYKLIAADANNSKSISTLDLIQIRKLILNVDTEFSNNTSWRFVDADYRFPDATNPWAESFPEIKNINNLSDRFVLANFTGVKIGDVNGSARANAAQSIGSRSVVDVMEIRTEELDLKQGNVYTVSFAANMNDIAGYQFTLDLDQDAVELIDLKDGIAKSEHFGVFAREGVLTTSFHRNAEEVMEGSTLFSISLRAKADVALSEVIGISSRYTDAEAYTTADEDLAIGLVFGEGLAESDFALYQNRPNPFQAETVISFKLPEAMEGVLEFKDISGRTIMLKEGDYTKGYNEIRLKANELPAAGVYFYTLYAGEFAATKKLVMVKQ